MLRGHKSGQNWLQIRRKINKINKFENTFKRRVCEKWQISHTDTHREKKWKIGNSFSIICTASCNANIRNNKEDKIIAEPGREYELPCAALMCLHWHNGNGSVK